MTHTALTIVVCTHNRAELLTRTLDSLDAASRPSQSIDVLVVANCCTDRTHEILEERVRRRSNGLPFRWLSEPRKGKSHALNLALQRAQGDLIAFVDDDQRVDTNFICAICDAAVANADAALFCGRLIPDWEGTEPAWVHDKGPYRIYPLPVPEFDQGTEPSWLDCNSELPGGGNLVVRRDWVERIGPFSTQLGPVGHNLGGAEDSEWLRRALGRGARLRYIPAMVQRHHVDPNRLTLSYLMRLTYARTAAAVAIENGPLSVPRWAYRKLLTYGLEATISLNAHRRRFFLMRIAGALGEISGYRRRRAAMAA